MRGGGAFYSMPQFRDSDGGDLQLFTRLSGQPAPQVEAASLAFDDYISIDNYHHRSVGGFNLFRAAIRSLCQALASSSGKSTCFSASANSGAVQTFLLSGASR